MSAVKTAFLSLAILAFTGTAFAQDKPAAAPPEKPTINIQLDPQLSAAENAYQAKFKTLTPEQQAELKAFEVKNIEALDLDMQAMKTMFEVKHCGEKDASFAKDIEKFRAEAGVYNNRLQSQSVVARKNVRKDRMSSVKFIDHTLVDGHDAFMASMAVNFFGQMTKHSYDKGAFAKTDCAALAKKLDGAFASANTQTPAEKAMPDRIAEIRAGVAAGIPDAMVAMGMMKISGQGTEKDVTGGMELLTKAAEGGYSRAQYMLGLVYGSDLSGTPPDPAKAKMWLQKAAAQGDKKAQAMLDNPDAMKPPQTADELRKKAAAGDASAAYELGARYFVGMGGVEKNLDEAMKWKLMAAGAGHPLAQSDIAVQMLNENKNDEALTWMTKAATAGVVNSQYQLGLLYAQGGIVPKDLAGAKYWIQKAADAGDARAIALLQQLNGK